MSECKDLQSLNEASRNDLLSKSKSSVKGNQRYRRRVRSHVANSVREFNSIDMNRLFKNNILSVNINVQGETDKYVVRIAFSGFLDILHDELKRNNDKLDLKIIIKSLIVGFNKDDVYIGCTCPDSIYRFSYQQSQNKVDTYSLDGKKIYNKNLGMVDPQNIPANITNPHDTLGSGCKHTLLVLSNNSWIMKVASVINNYIKYMEKYYAKVYADIIYPAIYQKPYEGDVQLSIFDKNRKYAKTGKDTLDKANKATGRDEKGRFIQGNEEGQKFTAKPGKDVSQVRIFDDEDILS